MEELHVGQEGFCSEPAEDDEALPTELRAPSFFAFRRSAFPITETELNAIAAAAIIGFNNKPNNGYKMPAAIGTPSALYPKAKKRFWRMFLTVA